MGLYLCLFEPEFAGKIKNRSYTLDNILRVFHKDELSLGGINENRSNLSIFSSIFILEREHRHSEFKDIRG